MEADAVAAFSAWLDEIAEEGPASPPLAEADWVPAIRLALGEIIASYAPGRRQSPPELSPPASLDPAGASRSKITTPSCGSPIGSGSPNTGRRSWPGAAPIRRTAADCVLLAALDVPVLHIGDDPAKGWQVDGAAADVAIDESRRPLIASLQLVQTALGIMTEQESGWLSRRRDRWGQRGPSARKARPERGTNRAGWSDGRHRTCWPGRPTGSAGRPGAPGIPGPAGPQGPQGIPGKDADQIPFRLRTKVVSGNVTLDDAIDCAIARDAKINLPTLAAAGEGRSYYIKVMDVATIVPAPGEQLETYNRGAISTNEFRLIKFQSIQLVADLEQKNWLIIADYSPAQAG